MTSYVAVVGPHTAWPGVASTRLSDFKHESKTILLIELPDSGIVWTEPRDVSICQFAVCTKSQSGEGIIGHHPGGFNALFADGHVELLPNDIDPEQLASMFDIRSSVNSMRGERAQ